MKKWFRKSINYIEYLIIGFIFLILFVLPVLFTRINGEISWQHVIKIWKDQFLIIPVFLINHLLFVPVILFHRKYITYLLCVALLLAICTYSYYYYETYLFTKTIKKNVTDNKRPTPIPPYALLLMDSLLIVGVDTGLLFSKKWHEIEEKKYKLEKKNAEMQLEILRNQISPHFFMNTLNNIYALIDCDIPKAKQAVMKLSKLMRYMLYENESGKVKLSKEFEFIKSYIDLMKLRFSDDMTIKLILPNEYQDIGIPPMLYISYIENAFKFGASYQQESFITIVFEIIGSYLVFTCNNTKQVQPERPEKGGLGMQNSDSRLKLLFGSNFFLSINSTEKMFNVELKIPLAIDN
jgi:sensor histidine kinase YesM